MALWRRRYDSNLVSSEATMIIVIKAGQDLMISARTDTGSLYGQRFERSVFEVNIIPTREHAQHDFGSQRCFSCVIVDGQ
jgi:hypothetical protein